MENQDTDSSNNVESNLENKKDTKIVDSNTVNGVSGNNISDKGSNVNSQSALSNSVAGQQETSDSSPVIPNGKDSPSDILITHSDQLKGEVTTSEKQESVNHVAHLEKKEPHGDSTFTNKNLSESSNSVLTNVSTNGSSCSQLSDKVELKQSVMSNDVEQKSGIVSEKQQSLEGTDQLTPSNNASEKTESHSIPSPNQKTEPSHHIASPGIPGTAGDARKTPTFVSVKNEVTHTGKHTQNVPHIPPIHTGAATLSTLSHNESKKEVKPVISSHASEAHGKDKLPTPSTSSVSVPTSMPHLQMPHHDKNNPHLIPIPSLPNSMMNPAMSIAASGMNMFPPHMMNPYSMMFDPRFAAAFQQQMFRGMPPFNLRFPSQQPATRGSRPRGPRGPRQNKSQQQHHQPLPPEAMHHRNRPPPLDSSHLKIDPLPDSISSLPGGNIKDHSNEATHSSSSRSSTPRSQTSLTSPVTTQPEGVTQSDSMPQQPPPAHYHGKIEIPPLPPGMMPPAHSHSKSDFPPGAVPVAHSHSKTDLPPHLLGAAPPAHSHSQHGLPPPHPTESLPPLAHSTPASTAVKTSAPSIPSTVSVTQRDFVTLSTASTCSSVASSHHETIQNTSQSISTTAEISTVDVKAGPTVSNSTSISNSISLSLATSSPSEVTTIVNSHHDNLPTTVTSTTTSNSIPMPAHVHPLSQAVAVTSVSELIPSHAGTTNPVDAVSTSHVPVSVSGALTQAPSTCITTQSTSSTSSCHESPSVAVSIPISDGNCSVTPKSSLPPLSQVPGAIPSTATIPQMTMPGHFTPMGPMHPAMAPHFVKQKGRGQRMPGKQRGVAPEMPHGMPPGMMPPFGRFPPFMSPQIQRMAMSPEMMALAQKMVSSGPSVSEGEPGSGPQMPKLDPNQLELLRNMNMRMRPPFGMRPGMPALPRNMPPPPRYPGFPMVSPISSEGMPPRLVGSQQPQATSGQGSAGLTSPTPSLKSASESQSPHPSASPVAPSASPHSSVTGIGDKTPSPVPRSPANSDTTSVGSTPIKQEPIEQRISACFPEDDPRTATQNALLKQLLANSLAMNGGHGRPPGTPFSEDSEDGTNLQLTPEQQKQLDMIENMPAIREVELTPEEWAAKTPEEREKIIEIRKQQFEERRREFEDLRKKKKPTGEPRKRKKKGNIDQMFPPDMFGDGQMMMPQGPQPPPKKRQRRPKKKVDIEEDKDARVESFLTQLRLLANVPLQEPKVTSAIVNSPVYGSAQTLTGEGQLKGGFGNAYLENVADFYGSNPLGGLPPLGSLPGPLQTKDLDARRKFLSDGTDTTEQQKKLSDTTFPGQRSTPPFSISSLTGMPTAPVVPVLPPGPKIEPRNQSLRMTDSPDTVISSSSPEHEFGEENPDFPMLKPIDPPADEDRRSSPALPLLQPVAIKAEDIQKKDVEQQNVKKDLSDVKPVTDVEMADKKLAKLDPTLAALAEKDLNGKTNSFTSSISNPLKDKDISVTLTLSAKAAEDIGGVLSSIAELLKIAVPPTYQVRSPSPDSLKMGLKHKEDPINIHNLIKMKPKFCRNCDMVVIDKGYIRKKSEMPFMIKEDHFTFRESEDEDIAFCTQKCYERFVMVYKSIFKSGGLQKPGLDPTLLSDKSPTASSLSPFPSTPPTMISPRGSGFLTPNSSGERTPQLTPTTPTGAPMLTAGMEPATPTRQDKPRKKKADVPPKPPPKRWKNIRYKKWDPSFSQELQPRPETPKSEVEVLWKALGTIITPDPMPEDKRSCVFCNSVGDGVTDGPGRLLNMDVDKWAHLNCALWSSEVYETMNGDLMNVDVAFKRGQTTECHTCKKLGATLGCFKLNCSKTYHLGCALKTGCMFFQDKTILCPPHAPKILPDNVLTNLSVYRKVYVNRDEDKQVASMIRGQEEGTYALRISSLILHSVGQLLPHQIATGKFHTRDFIYPVGFKSSRFYWSMRRLYKRCRYVCSISDNDGKPEFMIRVVEAGFEDIVMKDNSPRAVWFKVLEPLDKMRRNADLVKIFPSFMTGEELFGLTEPAIIRVIESLPGTDLLKNYAFKFGRCELIEMPLTINPTGCARTEPKLRTHFRKKHTLQSSHTSRSLPVMVTGVTGDVNSPYMKQFVHSKSQQYRRLKTEWRTNVFLGRSRIQGLGLFAARDLEKHTMVIEYIGYLIRDEVANRLEISYNEQNRGVYMFRIDSDQVVDATMAGGPARYINHSCDPNCVAEVVPFDKESKIIIITNRRIPKGEELTYDYKFDFEDEQHKIPCCCGAKRCRKWMN